MYKYYNQNEIGLHPELVIGSSAAVPLNIKNRDFSITANMSGLSFDHLKSQISFFSKSGIKPGS